jgi:hypothetical protein
MENSMAASDNKNILDALEANWQAEMEGFYTYTALSSCTVPEIDGAYFSDRQKEALWDRFFTGAPARQRQCVERYTIVKRA